MSLPALFLVFLIFLFQKMGRRFFSLPPFFPKRCFFQLFFLPLFFFSPQKMGRRFFLLPLFSKRCLFRLFYNLFYVLEKNQDRKCFPRSQSCPFLPREKQNGCIFKSAFRKKWWRPPPSSQFRLFSFLPIPALFLPPPIFLKKKQKSPAPLMYAIPVPPRSRDQDHDQRERSRMGAFQVSFFERNNCVLLFPPNSAFFSFLPIPALFLPPPYFFKKGKSHLPHLSCPPSFSWSTLNATRCKLHFRERLGRDI